MPHLIAEEVSSVINSHTPTLSMAQPLSTNLSMRQKLRNSLTYQVYTGCFENALQLIDSSRPKHLNQTNLYHNINMVQTWPSAGQPRPASSNISADLERFRVVLNETDEWWTVNPSL